MTLPRDPLPQLRFEIVEAARILRMSRATLYERIRVGQIKAQRDDRRRYITAVELQRYVTSMAELSVEHRPPLSRRREVVYRSPR
jgi:predicted site-specific integrase-resolvase